jgi:hypothetical protein
VKTSHPDSDKNRKIDPAILAEYEGLLRLTRSWALNDAMLAQVEGDSFTVETDIIVDDFLSLEGIFSPPCTIKQGSSTLKILKDSYYRRDNKEIEGKIMTEMRLTYLLENEGAEEGKRLPEHIECSLLSETTYLQKTEASLLSRQKTYLEKSFVHTNTITKTPGWKEQDAGKSYTTRGFIRIDAASGHIMEESHE